jgi:hypothetical protein
VNDFVVVYPGVYTEREKTHFEKFIANNIKAIAERGEIGVQDLINGTLPKDTPGIGPTIRVTETMVRYNNEKYDPENPVLNDAEYAKKLGYQNILAYPTFHANDDNFMVKIPPEARDTLLVSSINENVTNYKPVYPGDTLYILINARHMTDLTPLEGSIFRSFAIKSEASIYNQKGEKVSDVIFRVTENLKYYKEDRRPDNLELSEFPLDQPDWMRRPAHYYTDDDWEFIKDLWAKEKRQGAEPLYWEDVKIADEPTWTVDGPVEETITPVKPYGMGVGGSRTMKKEIMDPKTFKTMVRGEKDGIYRMPNREDYIPPIPDNVVIPPVPDNIVIKRVRDETTEGRNILINFFGRDIAIRHIHNWMGDHGWLYSIRWGIMPPEAHAAHGRTVPVNPEAERFLEKVPKMKGKHVVTHGLTGDLAIVKSCVYDKYVRDGEFFVELGWWIETIDGHIWEDGGATVKLPSKNVK